MDKRAARDVSGQEGLRLASRTVALLLGLTLAACANGSLDPADTGAATKTPDPAAQSAAALASETEDEIDPTGPTPPILAAAPAAKPAIDHDPKALIGLDRSGLSKLLGEPRLVRRETPAEIWQYVGTECVFDVFLYEEQGAYRVIHAEARDDEVPLKTEPRSCLNQLLRERLEEPVS
jgi:hypothetical protein